eukprot:5137231-Amphidinium_carterae.1
MEDVGGLAVSTLRVCVLQELAWVAVSMKRADRSERSEPSDRRCACKRKTDNPGPEWKRFRVDFRR